jgi:UDP-2,3-diacylglucosamine pyrophosphatase LpxH
MNIVDEVLKDFATDRQKEYIDAVNQAGTILGAARLMNVRRSTIQDVLKAVKRKAAIQGYSPKHDMTRTVPDGFKVKGVSTYYNKDGKPSGQWVKSSADSERQEEIIRDFVLALAQDAGDDFDLKLAESLTCSAIDRLVSSAPSADTALLLNLGDMFHADNQKNVTNSGHQLDVDGRWAKVQQVGLKAMLHCIKRLLEKHQKVIFRINKGNHDGHSSYALALMISCYFDNEPRVQVDLSPAVAWYYKFGKLLIGSTHGDTLKGADLPSIMAADMPKEWGDTTHRVWYVGHVHHQDIKEYRGCTVEYVRTMAARDAWHQGQGYRAGRDMCLIVHHKQHGEIERHRCDIGMLSVQDN